MHMRVHTFIHQYQYRYTNTEGYDHAFIMRGDLYALTTSKVSTWAVPATHPMETSFWAESFQKLSILSAQAAGSGSPPGPRSKNLHFFWKGSRTRARKDIICVLAQEWPFFATANKYTLSYFLVLYWCSSFRRDP